MKTLYMTTVLLFTINAASAQVAIGKTSINGNNTILDFNNSSSNTNGIIPPAIADKSTARASTASNDHGTFIFDKSDNRIKMYENGNWVSLSDDTGDGTEITNHPNSSPCLLYTSRCV